MTNEPASKYTEDGVNVAEGDSFSKFAGDICRSTYKNSRFVEVQDFSRGHFRGPRGFRLKNLPAYCWMDAAPDGDGTKPVLVDAAHDYENGAHGWLAMTCGDITRWGGIPLVLVNDLNTKSLGKLGEPNNTAFRHMMIGLGRLANIHHLVLLKGETAELPGLVTSPNPDATATYLWSGVAIGAYNPKTIITGDELEKGMIVMALKENGFRNNGISSAREALRIRFGDNYYNSWLAKVSIEKAAAPAVIYDTFLATLNGWYSLDFKPVVQVFLISHLTGGGIKSKFAEDILFPRGLSAELNDLFDPPEIMKQCAEWRGMSDEECYETWNGGQGALVVINERDEKAFGALTRTFNIETKRAGVITCNATPSVIITSKFTGNLFPITKK